MNGQLDTGMVFHGSLPVRVEALAALPPEYELLHSNESNELLLRTVAALEDKLEHDETDLVSQELRRQDLKISLMLDMLGTLLRQYEIVPPLRELELTASAVTVSGGDKLPEMQHCRLAIYIEAAVPKALILYGTVHAGRLPGALSIQLHGIGQNVQDNLEKYIFRHHRRRVAQVRKT